MNVALKFLRRALYMTVFFVGVSLLYGLSESYDKLIDTTKDRISEEVMLIEAVPIVKENYVTKSQLITLLMGPLEYDIRIIDGSGTYDIGSVGYSPDTVGNYVLTGNQYEKSYHYDRNGAIEIIVLRLLP